MEWIKVTIFTTANGIEPLTGRLMNIGITGFEIEDEADFNDFLDNNKQYWDYVDEKVIKQMQGETRVIVYVSNNASGHEMLLSIENELNIMRSADTANEFGRLAVETDGINEEDWANNWKKYYHPIEIGEKILIKPVWEEVNNDTDRVIFNIEPGLSFGTGSHETTQLCLINLERYIKPGMKVLDLGCGSGILSIIALLLGAKKAVAVDIDKNAVDIAYENAKRNGIDDDRYTVYAGDIITDTELQKKIAMEEYDIVLANIVADVIIALTPTAKKYVKADGTFITSGIITDRVEDVKEALGRNNFHITDISQRKDWMSIVCKQEA
ncbi:MAG: 50S ribosomal protein L11 methyltransferase [Clostridia bacterium]|nr:50S ribosomal protein L11 methyltransferase [Clostridia bacterium]